MKAGRRKWDMANDNQTPRRPGLREQRRDQLLHDVRQVALRQFGERGYEATTLKEICEEAGISLRTLFRHFRGKDDILASRIADWSRRIPEKLSEQPSDLPLLQAYRIALLATVGDLESDREEVRLTLRLYDEVPGIRGEYLGRAGGHAEDTMSVELAERLDVHLTDPRIRLLRSYITSAVVQAMSDWSRGAVPGDLGTLVDRYLATIDGVPDAITATPWVREEATADTAIAATTPRPGGRSAAR
ncbi:helix-turn-helix domain-containing protein [Pseudonocardia xishanensis]|uniref:TetR family transcriptional regulator n=1 Tax=Pseudonocardia xishanensis TaxID=630995 RepID=A0ABP8RZC6_9PSEU